MKNWYFHQRIEKSVISVTVTNRHLNNATNTLCFRFIFILWAYFVCVNKQINWQKKYLQKWDSIKTMYEKRFVLVFVISHNDHFYTNSRHNSMAAYLEAKKREEEEDGNT